MKKLQSDLFLQNADTKIVKMKIRENRIKPI